MRMDNVSGVMLFPEMNHGGTSVLWRRTSFVASLAMGAEASCCGVNLVSRWRGGSAGGVESWSGRAMSLCESAGGWNFALVEPVGQAV
jgi:hypothetical protein